MGIYKFKEKGAPYGFGHTEGELVEFPDGKTIYAQCLVPEVDPKNNNTGRMVMAEKNYTADFLMESGVIVQATPEEVKKFKAGDHINARADKAAAENAAREESQRQARLTELGARK